MIISLLSEIWPILAGLGALLALLVGYGAQRDKKTRERAKNEAEEIDNAKANDMRNRVERDLPDRVRKFDDAGYRD